MDTALEPTLDGYQDALRHLDEAFRSTDPRFVLSWSSVYGLAITLAHTHPESRGPDAEDDWGDLRAAYPWHSRPIGGTASIPTTPPTTRRPAPTTGTAPTSTWTGV